MNAFTPLPGAAAASAIALYAQPSANFDAKLRETVVTLLKAAATGPVTQASSLGAYEESGAWRIGIKCDTALSDFPWRWALAPRDEVEEVHDEETGETYYYLQPGQQAEVWGAIRMTELITARNPQDCWAGLIHEDVGIPAFQSRVGAREIELVPPPENID